MANSPVRPVSGRVVAITGAARGIGFAAARALSQAGAKIAIGDLDGDVAAESAAALPNAAIGLALDVTDRDSFDAFLTRAEEELGPLDVLVNNAGVMFVGSFFDEDDGAARKMTEVNFYGTLTGMKLAERRMRGRGGHIVNVASMSCWIVAPGEATYSGTKHAVKGVAEALRFELAGSGIDLSLVFPAVVETELAAGTTSGRSRMLSPDEIGAAILETVRHPREEVFVPRHLGPLLRGYAGLPPRARKAIARLAGVDKVATGAGTRAARAEYERRIGAR
jgi:NAD(P)-dependent dehydrogenase (short-subunit alcohol dehydrogenase family)